MNRVERNERAQAMLAYLGLMYSQHESHSLPREAYYELGEMVAKDFPMLINVLSQHVAMSRELSSSQIRNIEAEACMVAAETIHAIKEVNKNGKYF